MVLKLIILIQYPCGQKLMTVCNQRSQTGLFLLIRAALSFNFVGRNAFGRLGMCFFNGILVGYLIKTLLIQLSESETLVMTTDSDLKKV